MFLSGKNGKVGKESYLPGSCVSYHTVAARESSEYVNRSPNPVMANGLESETRATRHCPTDAFMEKRCGQTESVESGDGSPLRNGDVGRVPQNSPTKIGVAPNTPHCNLIASLSNQPYNTFT